MRMQVRSLNLLRGLRIRYCHELWCGHRPSSDLALLWLWCRLAAATPVRPLAWEPPYAAHAYAALKKAKKKKRRTYTCTYALCFLSLNLVTYSITDSHVGGNICGENILKGYSRLIMTGEEDISLLWCAYQTSLPLCEKHWRVWAILIRYKYLPYSSCMWKWEKSVSPHL